MLIGTSTRKIDLPHEKGQWIEVCDLPRKVIKESKRLNMVESMKSMKDFSDIMQALMGKTPDPNVKETVESYDLDHILEYAVKGWSYDAKVDKTSIALLDQKTAEYVANDLLGIEEEGDKVKD